MNSYFLRSISGTETQTKSKVYGQQLIRGITKLIHDLEHESYTKPTITKTTENLSFPSGCTYDGEMINGTSWEGEGKYTFPHNATYTGSFSDSEFHGFGIIKYPMGQTLHGEWVKGKLVSWSYLFPDGLEYSDEHYCTFPYRAFYTTIKAGKFRPPDQEALCNNMPPRTIPPGCYDCGEGFYNPKLCCIVSSNEANKILRIPTAEEATWIEKNCRSAETKPTGYRPDLYEYWCSGSAESLDEIITQIEKERMEAYNTRDDVEEEEV